MEHFPLLVPLLIALSSALHCLGMCGGIIGAMTFGFPPDLSRGRLLLFLAAAHGGRILSYAVAGGVMALFGQTVLTTVSPRYGHAVLQVIAAVTLILTGLFLSGRFPGLRLLEHLGAPVWRRIEPFARRFIAPRTPTHAFFFGALWGWLPCSLVYSALLWSSTACTPAWGPLAMILFGLGTLPATLPATWLFERMHRFAKWIWIKELFAVMLILLGIATLHWTGRHLHQDPFALENRPDRSCGGDLFLSNRSEPAP